MLISPPRSLFQGSCPSRPSKSEIGS